MDVIFLNGCTSAGKSSIARLLQTRLATPHLRTGIDDAFALLPDHLHNHPEGFSFDRCEQGQVRLNFGPFGLATLKAHNRAAAAMARSGVPVILDEVILTDELRADWHACLQGLSVFFVGVHCDLEVLERREIARGDRVIGQARGQYEIVHRGLVYDLELDTTLTETSACVAQILEALPQRLVTL